MRHLIGFVLVIVLCSSVAFGVELSDYPLKTWLEDGEEWLCEEHYVVDDPFNNSDLCYACFLSNRPMILAETGNPVDLMPFMASATYYTASGSVRFNYDQQGWYTTTAPLLDTTSSYGPDYYWSVAPTATLTNPGTNWVHMRVRMTYGSSYLSASDFTYFLFIQRTAGYRYFTNDPLHILDGDDGYVDFWCPLNQTGAASSDTLGVQIGTNISGVSKMEISVVEVYQNVSLDTIPDGGGTDEPIDETPDWINKNYGAGVDPEITENVGIINDSLDSLETIENGIFGDLDTALDSVDPENVAFPTSIITAMQWLSTYTMDLFGVMGEFQFVITFSMFLGLSMVFIGRYSWAINNNMAKSDRMKSAKSDSGKVEKGGKK